MEAQIQIRRSTAAQWISANPILASGEPGLETDTGKGKYGDGTTHWINLQYSWQWLGSGPTGPAGGSLTGNYPNPTLALNTVGSPQLIDGGVGAAELATNAVTSVKIADLNVTTAKLADGAVTSAKLAPGGIGSAQIADGSVALADLAPATVSALKLDVMDEGAVRQADADIINFVGAGVAVSSGSGIATVTISGAPATAFVAGTIAQWHDPVPPAGWYLCDGTVHADLAGTIGTKYGATPGTVPLVYPQAQDAYTNTVSDVYSAAQPGWQVTATVARRQSGFCTVHTTFTRTGANIVMSGPNHADVTMTSMKSPWIPDFSVAGICSNEVRHGFQSTTGSTALSAGIGNDGTATVSRDEVITFTYHYPAPNGQTIPRVYTIIKGA